METHQLVTALLVTGKIIYLQKTFPTLMLRYNINPKITLFFIDFRGKYSLKSIGYPYSNQTLGGNL